MQVMTIFSPNNNVLREAICCSCNFVVIFIMFAYKVLTLVCS